MPIQKKYPGELIKNCVIEAQRHTPSFFFEPISAEHGACAMYDQLHTEIESLRLERDEYAKQKSEFFLRWVEENKLCPNSSGLWFNYGLSIADVHFYTISQLYIWFDTGVQYEPAPLANPQ